MKGETEVSSISLYKLKEIMKELINTIDVLNFDCIHLTLHKRSVIECVFKEINKLYTQFDANKNQIQYINRSIFPNILKHISKINEKCKSNELKCAYIRQFMIPQIFAEIHYLYDLCESKPFDYEIKFIEQFVIPKCLKMFYILYTTFGEFKDSTAAKGKDMSLVMKDSDYHGHLSWSNQAKCFFFVPHIRKKPKDHIDCICGPEKERLVFGGDFFASGLDGFHILYFLN